MASIVDKIVTNVSAGIENAIHFLDSFVHSKEETEIKVKTDYESDKLPSREKVKDTAAEAWDATKDKAKEVKADIKDKADDVKDKGNDMSENIKNKASDTWENAKEKGEELKKTVQDKMEKASEKLDDKATDASERLSKAWDDLSRPNQPHHHTGKSPVGSSASRTKADDAKEKAEEAKDKADEAGEKMKDTAADAWDATKAKATEVKEDVKEKSDNASERMHQAWDDLAHPNHPHHHPESKSPVGNASSHTKTDDAKEKAEEAKDKADEAREKLKDTAADAWDATKAKASEIKEDVKEKADNASERLHQAWDDLAHPNHPHHHPESKSPVGGASLNMAEVLSAEDSLILPGSASGNNASAVDPSVFSVAVPVNQLPEIAPMVSDF